ncbi:MAG: Ig-like domain-containing protein, partial [Actinobacteria bacterium]|nr:Ig-like domain-containing protein [Actinomycetota bacterium]
AAATITFTLDKATTDFDISDISTTSGTMSAFVGSSSTLYTATYTPASGFSGSATISVDAASFVDAGGLANSAGTLTLTVDTTPPTVTAITSTNVNGYYGVGAVIDVTVTFSELVNVLSAAGIPSLLLETGTTDRAAAYLSGSGTNTVTFRYTVQAGDISADLDEQSASALAVNGGSIKDVAGNNATLTVPAPGAAGSLGANKAIVVDSVAPSAPTALSAVGVGGTAIASKLNSTNTDLAATATIIAGEATGGSAQLLLGATVIATDATISSGDTSIAFTLGTATAAALQALISTGGSLTVRVLDATGNVSTASAAVTLTVDYSSPSVTLASSRSSLINGQTATITATLSEASTTFASASATVSGGTLSSWSGSGTTYTATFTPASASSGTASISYAMGSWTDLSSNPSNAATALTLPFDTALPTVTSISSSTANGVYKAGAVIDITVTFSETVFVTTGTGTPTLLLETGTTDRAASYTSGSGSSTLNFRYTVQAGDSSADLNQQSAAALVLNGGVIADSAGNNATLTLPAITSGATGALATNAAIVIDTEAPSAPTTVAVIPVGGTVVANTLLASNTNMTSTASITAGQATGGYAELLLGSSVIATDLLISSGDSSVAFDLGLSGAAALQATIAASGNLTVRLYDAVGNVSAASAARSLTVDYIVPTVTVTSTRTAFTLGQTATVTFTLSEDSANFISGDVTVVNGSLTSFSGSGSSYTATFTPATGNALVGSISVASGALTDAAGNSNSASNTVGLTIDTVAPTVSSFTSTTADGSYRLGQSINMRAVMTESVLAGSTMTI